MRKSILIIFTLVLFTGVAIGRDDKSPKEILDDAVRAWNSIQDFHCKLQSNNRKGEEKDLKKVEFWFKKRQQVRLLVLEGENEGSVLTRNDTGEINGKKGGILGVVSLTLDEDDERILNLRGRKFYLADWGTLLREFRARVDSGWEIQRLEDAKEPGGMCYVLEHTGREPQSDVTRERLWIDQRTNLMVRKKQYAGDTLVTEVVWWDIEINTGLEDDLFEL